jgi:hypothetical protein
MKCDAYAHNTMQKCKPLEHTHNAMWKHTQHNYIATKHKQMKFSKRNANTMHKVFKGNIYIKNCQEAQTQN